MVPKRRAAGPATLAVKQKAVAEYNLRKAAGASTKGLGLKFGVSDASVYNWVGQALAGSLAEPARPGNKGKGGKGNGFTPDEKADAVHDVRKHPGPIGRALEEVGKLHGVSSRTLRDWMAERPQEELALPHAPAPKPEPQPGRAYARRKHTDDFKAKVVEAYVQREKGVFAEEIGRQFGVDPHLIHRWHKDTRNGKLMSQPRAPAEHTAPSNGHAIAPHRETMQLMLDASHVEPPPHDAIQVTGMAAMHIQRLEHQNKVYRKIIALLMEQM